MVDRMWIGRSDLDTLPVDPPQIINERRETGKEYQKSRPLVQHMLRHLQAPDNESASTVYTDEDWENGLGGVPPIFIFPPSGRLGRNFYTLVSCGLSGTLTKPPINDRHPDLFEEHSTSSRMEIICHIPETWDKEDKWPITIMRLVMSYVIETGHWLRMGGDRPHQNRFEERYRTLRKEGMRIPFVEGSKMTHVLFVVPFESEDFECVYLENDDVTVSYRQIILLTEKELRWKEQNFGMFLAGTMRVPTDPNNDEIGNKEPAIGPVLNPFRPCAVEDLHCRDRMAQDTFTRRATGRPMPSKLETISKKSIRDINAANPPLARSASNRTPSFRKNPISSSRSGGGGSFAKMASFSQSQKPSLENDTWANLSKSKQFTSYDIIVTVRAGRNLVAKDRNLLGQRVSSDPYVCVHHGNYMLGKTKVNKKTLNPKWGGQDGESFMVTVGHNLLKKVGKVEFRIFDYDRLSADDPMGTASVPLPSPSVAKVEDWFPVEKGEGENMCKNATGEILVGVEIRPSCADV